MTANARPRQDTPNDSNDFWWTASGESSSSAPEIFSDTFPTFLPSSSDTSSFSDTNYAIPTISEASSIPTPFPSSSDNVVSITTSVPIIITQSASASSSISDTAFLSTRAATAVQDAVTGTSELQVQPVCIGDGLDAQSIGLISTVIVPSVIGIILWVSTH